MSNMTTWEDIKKEYECPEWFRDAKFGIWAHWGPNSAPKMGGGWYARHMYLEDVGDQTFGENAFRYHRGNYGHQSEFGFKDLCNHWKAEQYDPDKMIAQWKKWGAKYVAILCNHHDRFDQWNSKHHDWNSVRVGPKRDIVGEFAEAARKHNLPWVATVHEGSERWYEEYLDGAFGADEDGPKKGVPYDGYLKKEDGQGTWWEGLDPQQMYGLPPTERTDEWRQQLRDHWYKRHLQLINDYRPDALYFDSERIPHDEAGEKLCAEYYRQSRERMGNIEAIVQVKKPDPGTMLDVERGGAREIREEPWQTDTTLACDWFVKYDIPHHLNARLVLESLCDIVSKNGNLLLNVGLNADGTLPPDQLWEMNVIGDWLEKNGDAIYGTRPWTEFRNGSGVQQEDKIDLKNVAAQNAAELAKSGHFSERTKKSPPYHHDEVRFTVRDDRLYVCVLNPAPGKIAIPSLAADAAMPCGNIKNCTLLDGQQAVEFEQTTDALTITLPKDVRTGLPLAIELS